MATDSLVLETIDGKDKRDIDISGTKKTKRGKRYQQPENTNGVIENGHEPTSETFPVRSPENLETKKSNYSSFETPTRSHPTQEIINRSSNRSNQPSTPLQSNQSDSRNYQQIELSTVTDDDDDDDQEREQRRNVQPMQNLTRDHDTMVSSYTTNGENDTIEIHEFTAADIDAYLDIYFETLHNRLNHFVGPDEQLQQFRVAMKNRISSDTNSREYQNVLLGKMNGDVVAAVMLSFPGETTTVSNTQVLPQSTSCVTSIRRWMVRNANYVPTNMEECYIEMLGVKNTFRNNGIGTAILECVEIFARQAGALLLTVHVPNEQLQNYFQRFGFNLDHTDSSAFWKWIVERQSIMKMSKTISPDNTNNENSMDNTSGYVNESTIGSEGE